MTKQWVKTVPRRNLDLTIITRDRLGSFTSIKRRISNTRKENVEAVLLTSLVNVYENHTCNF